jgi:lipopolysaccharide biosynthesis glycosyltransferase
MASWVLALIANEPYIERAKTTIVECREIGDWCDDIVLMVPRTLMTDNALAVFAKEHRVQLKELPSKNYNTVLDLWEKNKGSCDYEYIKSRSFIYMKFYLFDMFFKQWDVVFYIDAGMKVFNSLNSFKIVCEPQNCLYAHSDSYPTFEWKLHGQFSFELMSAEHKEALRGYNLDIDYFQSTLIIYDTVILEESIVEELFSLVEQFPSTRRGDQPILNLYFNCAKGLWRQIPMRYENKLLYDYRQRDSFLKTDYCLLKWV